MNFATWKPCLGACLLLLGSCSRPASETPAVAAPNIVLISIDTLRADRLHCYGYERPTSPQLDRLAADGVLFSQARSPSSWTLPSHASMFLGVSQTSHGVTSGKRRISEEQTTLAEILRSDGYATAGFYSGFLVSRRFGFAEGFDVYEQGPVDFVSTESSPTINAKAKAWLTADREEPFFLFLHYFDVHDPYSELLAEHGSFRSSESPPSELAELYTDAERSPRSGRAELDRAKRRSLEQILSTSGVGVPEKLDESAWKTLAEELRAEGSRALAEQVVALQRARIPRLLDSDDAKWISDSYDDGVRYVDAHVGAIVDLLRELAIYEDALVLVVSDHGETLLDRPGKVGHRGSPYEPVLHVPLIIKPPGGESGRRVDLPVSTVDIFHTVLDYADVKGDGRSAERGLRRAIEGRSVRPPDYLLSEDIDSRGAERALYSLPWKLISKADSPERDALFDLSVDPREGSNLVTSHPEIHSRLRQLLDRAVEDAELDRLPASANVDPDARATETLRALGYAQ